MDDPDGFDELLAGATRAVGQAGLYWVQLRADRQRWEAERATAQANIAAGIIDAIPARGGPVRDPVTDWLYRQRENALGAHGRVDPAMMWPRSPAADTYEWWNTLVDRGQQAGYVQAYVQAIDEHLLRGVSGSDQITAEQLHDRARGLMAAGQEQSYLGAEAMRIEQEAERLAATRAQLERDGALRPGLDRQLREAGTDVVRGLPLSPDEPRGLPKGWDQWMSDINEEVARGAHTGVVGAEHFHTAEELTGQGLSADAAASVVSYQTTFAPQRAGVRRRRTPRRTPATSRTRVRTRTTQRGIGKS